MECSPAFLSRNGGRSPSVLLPRRYNVSSSEGCGSLVGDHPNSRTIACSFHRHVPAYNIAIINLSTPVQGA